MTQYFRNDNLRKNYCLRFRIKVLLFFNNVTKKFKRPKVPEKN